VQRPSWTVEPGSSKQCDAGDELLSFKDADGNVVTLKREGALVNGYVNDDLKVKNVINMTINLENRTYEAFGYRGSFVDDEDCTELIRKRDILLNKAETTIQPAPGSLSREDRYGSLPDVANETILSHIEFQAPKQSASTRNSQDFRGHLWDASPISREAYVKPFVPPHRQRRDLMAQMHSELIQL